LTLVFFSRLNSDAFAELVIAAKGDPDNSAPAKSKKVRISVTPFFYFLF